MSTGGDKEKERWGRTRLEGQDLFVFCKTWAAAVSAGLENSERVLAEVCRIATVCESPDIRTICIEELASKDGADALLEDTDDNTCVVLRGAAWCCVILCCNG